MSKFRRELKKRFSLTELELAYFNSFEVLGQAVLKLKERHPDNVTVNEMVNSLNVIGVYAASQRIEEKGLRERIETLINQREELRAELQALENKILNS